MDYFINRQQIKVYLILLHLLSYLSILQKRLFFFHNLFAWMKRYHFDICSKYYLQLYVKYYVPIEEEEFKYQYCSCLNICKLQLNLFQNQKCHNFNILVTLFYVNEFLAKNIIEFKIYLQIILGF
jgi:hypothetical protein